MIGIFSNILAAEGLKWNKQNVLNPSLKNTNLGWDLRKTALLIQQWSCIFPIMIQFDIMVERESSKEESIAKEVL